MNVNGGDSENKGKSLIVIVMEVHRGRDNGINKGKSECGQWLWQ